MSQEKSYPRIVLGVTSPVSLRLMSGYPEYLSEQGWDVHVVTSNPRREHHLDGVTMHDVRMTREPSPVRDAVALIGWLWKLVRLRPDVAVTGTPKAGLLGMIAAWCIRVPVRVYLLRGLRLETESGFKRQVLLAMEWVAARAATHVQSVSRSLSAEFVALGLAPESKVRVLGEGSSNGVELIRDGDLEVIPREALDLADHLPVIGFVGRMTRDKGVDTLLRAVELLHANGTAVQVLLVGPEEPAGSLSAVLAGLDLNGSSVRWVGPVPDARPYFPAMDVLCLPTRREGFPNVVLEAAVQGVPAVVSNVTGARDSVVDGCTGAMFEDRDSVELAGLLAQLFADASHLRAMGDQARRRAVRSYRRESVWKLNQDYLESLIQERCGKVRR